MSDRVCNFNAGPTGIPLPVLKIVQDEFLNYRGSGMSIIESSHRAAEYDEINETAIALTREIFGLGEDYHVMFMTGGASSQFAFIPLNFLSGGKTGAYVDTGTWSSKAIKEAKIIGKAHLAFDGKKSDYTHIPTDDELDIPSDTAYLHYTSNNTIKGTQFQHVPDSKGRPLICDMSSDIASRRLDFTKFSMIYAGAQKNIGPAGMTLVIMRNDLLEQAVDKLPSMFMYRTHADSKSLYNTPPVFGVYVYKLVLEWIKGLGGLAGIEKINMAKKERIYQLMDLYPDYYRGTVEPESRSWMNITMRLQNEELEKKLIGEAKVAGFVGLKGHRSVGGVRISMYNAVSLETVEKLAGFLEDFKKKN